MKTFMVYPVLSIEEERREEVRTEWLKCIKENMPDCEIVNENSPSYIQEFETTTGMALNEVTRFCRFVVQCDMVTFCQGWESDFITHLLHNICVLFKVPITYIFVKQQEATDEEQRHIGDIIETGEDEKEEKV